MSGTFLFLLIVVGFCIVITKKHPDVAKAAGKEILGLVGRMLRK